MTLPLLPGAPDQPVRCANPFCRRRLRRPSPTGYGPECARQYGLTTPHIPAPRTDPNQDGPDLLDLLNQTEQNQ